VGRSALTSVASTGGRQRQHVGRPFLSDNGKYIGHDEPDMTFPLKPGRGRGTTSPGTRRCRSTPRRHRLSARPEAMCPLVRALLGAPVLDGDVRPLLVPAAAVCAQVGRQRSDLPQGFKLPEQNSYPGAGSAVMEMQLYPPGNPPSSTTRAAADAGWCAAMTIDSLECTDQYATCQPACEEPINYAFIQTNGVPTGPAGPGDSDFDTAVPNKDTLIMKPGDRISVHMFDAPAPKVKGALGGRDAFEVVINDLTQNTSGFMQASAANGFQYIDMNCDTAAANWQPEYNTATSGNIIPWAALADGHQHRVRDGSPRSVQQRDGSYPPPPPSEQLPPPAFYGSNFNPFDPYDTGGTYSTCVGATRASAGKATRRPTDCVRRQRHACRLGPRLW